MPRQKSLPSPSARPPVHPGEILREDVLPALGISVTKAAQQLGVSRQTLHAIMRAEDPKPITPAMALRFGKFCGNGPELWLKMQNTYDLWHGARTLHKELKAIPSHAA